MLEYTGVLAVVRYRNPSWICTHAPPAEFSAKRIVAFVLKLALV